MTTDFITEEGELKKYIGEKADVIVPSEVTSHNSARAYLKTDGLGIVANETINDIRL